MANTGTNKTTEAKRIKELEAQIKELKELMGANKNTEETVSHEEPVEISPNKKTKITSLTYGILTLSAPNRARLRFDRFGQTLTVTYAQLCDYVNNCRDIAEAGGFYIHNAEMVEELELGSYYDNIISDEIIDKIIKEGTDRNIEILKELNISLKDTFSEIFASKIFKGEFSDLNEIDKVSRALDINLMEKVEQMRSMNEIMSSK